MSLNQDLDANWNVGANLMPPANCVDAYHELDVLYGGDNRRQLT